MKIATKTYIRCIESYPSFDKNIISRRKLVCLILSIFRTCTTTLFCWTIIRTNLKSQLKNIFFDYTYKKPLLNTFICYFRDHYIKYDILY